MIRSLVFIVILASVPVVSAQIDGNPENWCRTGFFTRESVDFRIGVVKPLKEQRVKRSYFRNDDRPDCPGGRGCETRSYVVPGDEVIVNRTFQGFACSWYTSARGEGNVGWLRLSDLDIQESVRNVSLNAWIGEWRYGENTIKLNHNKLVGWLNVVGDAYWNGMGDNIHIGELDGRAEPQNGILKYSDGDDEYDCQATMRLLGSYLIVSDNMKCGGANVSFSGVYRKAR
jgi:hypothetical protein